MNLTERIILWFSLYGDECKDDEVRNLLDDAQEELAAKDQENERLRRELDEAKRAHARLQKQYTPLACGACGKRMGVRIYCPECDMPEIVQLRAENERLRGELERLTVIGIENLERIDRWREAYINLRDSSREQQADIDRLRIKLAEAWLKIGALTEVDDA